LLEDIAISPDERRAILHRYIEPTQADRDEGRKIPTAAHHAIAQLVRSGHVRVIITTNFDRLMENALREQGIEPTVISSVDSLAGAEPISHSQCYLFKVHGDYKDARILNTDQELSEYPEDYNRLLDRIFDEHGLIICGWSGEWDHALRSAFLRAPNRRYPLYWASRGTLGDGALELVEHRKAKVIPIDGADKFFPMLQQQVETLDQSLLQNPLSIELLTSTVKRYLSKSEHRIQLDELFSQETERLLAQLDEINFHPNAEYNTSEFRSRVLKYEALTEPLARMAGILGRWGDGSDLGLMLDILRALYHQAQKLTNGYVPWLHLRSYPTVLVFTAYGLGLAHSKRWEILHEIFQTSWIRENREPKKVVATLFHQSWDGAEITTWQQLEGFERRKTPLSDHMFEIMSKWRSSFAGITPDFELIFGRFEILGSLAYLEQNDESSLEQAMKNTPHGVFAGMPVGRIGWHEQLQALIQELQSESIAFPLLKAGFSCGSRRFLELSIENLKRVSSMRYWR